MGPRCRDAALCYTAHMPVLVDDENTSPTGLKAIVEFYIGPDERWKETTALTSVSRIGATLKLSKPSQIGRLMSLMLPMPREMRLYDLDDQIYQIVGIVQYCHASTAGESTVYDVGLGFVGKNAPESYRSDPMQSYRASGAGPDGLWRIVPVQSQFKTREAARLSVPLDVTISYTNQLTRAVDKQPTQARDSSATGASVVCWLGADIGDRVKFACDEYNFYAFAIVRGRKEHYNGPPTLHLEFVDGRFPVEKLPTQ